MHVHLLAKEAAASDFLNICCGLGCGGGCVGVGAGVSVRREGGHIKHMFS